MQSILSQVFIIVKGLEVLLSCTWSESNSFCRANLNPSILRYPNHIVDLVRFGRRIQIWRRNQPHQLSTELFQFILKHLVVFVVKSNWGWFLLFFVSRRNRWSSLQRTALPFLRFFHQYRNFFLKQTILSCLFNITQRLFNLEDINLSFVNREIWLFSSIFSCFTDIRRVADLRPPYSIQK